ncbi:MAG: 4Fe-4S dicluster domain-containing protein [Thermodesulfobacteriota bacterium]
MKERIGVYICHCGTNIAGKVRVEEVRDYVATLKDVVVARDYLFMCSDPGQEIIEKDIPEHRLTRVVVASCSPRMHEITFRGAVKRGGLNPFRSFQMICIREHCSWVTQDADEATQKAKELIRGAVNRVRFHRPLQTVDYPVNPNVLIVGGGIAGMQAALDVAKAGYKAYLVERQPTIGGHMLQFDKTFPTLDCASCIGTPKMVSVGQNPNIELMTYSEVQEVSGFVGNYKVKVRRRPRYVDLLKCTGCGECASVTIPEDHPVKEANGNIWVDRLLIDEARCIHCGECVAACVEENPETQGMTNIVRMRFQEVGGPQQILEPTLLQRLLAMSQAEREEFWEGQFKKCVKCYGCMDVCPVFLEDSDGLDIASLVDKGQVPPPFPLFHLIRAYKVWDTCVGCGECERTCPAHIPLKTVQDIVRYLPPERVFSVIPGLGTDAQKLILNYLEQKKGSSRRLQYAV